MIKIEITELQYEEPENLLAVAEYLQKIAKNNQERIDTVFKTEMSEPPTSDIPLSEVATIGELTEKLWPQLAGRVEREEDIYPPEHNSTQRVNMDLYPQDNEPGYRPGMDAFKNLVDQGEKIKNLMNNIIEEELIPVPPETVTLPIPEPAAVFAKCQEIPATPSVDLDAQGLPWDFRIHARTKSKNKDGSWKRLRGVSNNTAEKVETELKGVQNIPSAPVVPKPPEAPAMDFSAMMTLITTAITNKKIERHEVMKVLDAFGIPSIPVAATRPDLIPGIIVELQAVINESK